MGYQGAYFTSEDHSSATALQDGYILSSPVEPQKSPRPTLPVAAHISEVDDFGFISDPEGVLSTPKILDRDALRPTENTYAEDVIDPGAETDPGVYGRTWRDDKKLQDEHEVPEDNRKGKEKDEDIAQVVLFEYGVVVFFGLQEQQEKDILEDIHKVGIVKGMFGVQDWEIEECHFAVR